MGAVMESIEGSPPQRGPRRGRGIELRHVSLGLSFIALVLGSDVTGHFNRAMAEIVKIEPYEDSTSYETVFSAPTECSERYPGDEVAVGDFNNDGMADVAFYTRDTYSESTDCPQVQVVLQAKGSWSDPIHILWNSSSDFPYTEIKLGRQMLAANLSSQFPGDELILSAPYFAKSGSEPGDGALIVLSLPDGINCILNDDTDSSCDYTLIQGGSGDKLGFYDISILGGDPDLLMASAGNDVQFFSFDPNTLSLSPDIRLEGPADSDPVYSLLGNSFVTSDEGTGIQQAFIGMSYGSYAICDEGDLDESTPSIEMCETYNLGDENYDVALSSAIAVSDSLSLIGASTNTPGTVSMAYLIQATEQPPYGTAIKVDPDANVPNPPGFGTALAALDLDGLDPPELAISAVDYSTSVTSSDVFIFQRIKGVWTALMKYSDSTGTRLGTALGVIPGQCSRGGIAARAPGLLMSAPEAPLLKEPALILVCPTDVIDVDQDGKSIALDCDDSDNTVNFEADEICDGKDNNCDGVVPSEESDGDQDTYVECTPVDDSNKSGGDCDDDKIDVHPGALETCDGVDSDCVEGDGLPCDTDEDGYCGCEVSDPPCYCDNPQNNLGDCNDSNAEMNPDEDEICGDGIDNDCDGSDTDCDDVDSDHDNYTPNKGDCNDADVNVNPDMTETCGDQINGGYIDSNCDGQPNNGNTDMDGDGYISYLCQNGTDCNDSSENGSDIHPGADETECNDIDNDCDGISDEDATDSDHDGTDDCYDIEQCDGQDNDGDGSIDEGFDIDGDDYISCDGDCNDNNSAINPDIIEICDFLDNNCDGDIDEGYDIDHDDYSSCHEGVGCDNNSNAYPGHSEVCDGVDENCDGVVDDGLDSDGDGIPVCATSTDESGKLLGFDCDDENPFISPDALEVCNGLDDNCDGLIDEGWDEDENGQPDCADFDKDGFSYEDGDCNDLDSEVSPGELEVCDSKDNNCDDFTDEGFNLDEDGFNSCGGSDSPADCNDASSSVYPGAPELCDFQDNNCDGRIDEDNPELDQTGDGTPDCQDNDEDGLLECTGASDEDAAQCDCDDLRADCSPLIVEVCDGLDNNCDGAIDEYFDIDGDGYTSCELPVPDCADQDGSRFPSAPESCNGVDDDCDERIDEQDQEGDLDADGDGSLDCLDDDKDGFCEGDVCLPWEDGTFVGTGDCNDRTDTRSPLLDEIGCNGIDEDCSCPELDDTLCTAAELSDGSDDDGIGGLDCQDDDGDGFLEVGAPPDCNDADRRIHPGVEEVCDQVDNDCNGYMDEMTGLCLSGGCSISPQAMHSRTGASSWSVWAGLTLVLARLSRRSHRLRRPPWVLQVLHHGRHLRRIGQLTLFVLLCLAVVPNGTLHAAPCQSAWDERTFMTTLRAIEQQVKTGEYDDAYRDAMKARSKLVCFQTPINPSAISRLPLLLGIVSWYAKRFDDARQWFQEALSIDGHIRLDLGVPQGAKDLFAEELEHLVGRQKVRLFAGNPSFPVMVDAQPLLVSLPVTPGSHIVQVQSGDRTLCTWWLEVSGVQGDSPARQVYFRGAVGAFPGCTQQPVLGARAWPRSRIGLIATGVGATLSVVSMIALQSDYQALTQRAANDERCPDSSETQAACDAYHQKFVATWVALGATAIAGGVTWMFYVSEQTQLKLETSVGTRAGNIRLSIQF